MRREEFWAFTLAIGFTVVVIFVVVLFVKKEIKDLHPKQDPNAPITYKLKRPIREEVVAIKELVPAKVKDIFQKSRSDRKSVARDDPKDIGGAGVAPVSLSTRPVLAEGKETFQIQKRPKRIVGVPSEAIPSFDAAVDQLADKIKKTTPQGWTILRKELIKSLLVDCVSIAFYLFILAYWFTEFKKNSRMPFNNTAQLVYAIITLFFVVFMSILCIYMITNVTKKFVSPDYYIVKDLFDKVLQGIK